ncbi:neutral trehalase [Opitutaceae bacterium TAV1]|nr:neutral trehalase [Opitutaceae bacterium TAV1]
MASTRKGSRNAAAPSRSLRRILPHPALKAPAAVIRSPATDAVRDFIHRNWAATLRTHTEDEGTLLGLPHPYTVPCRRAMFQELYYWDTYFTALGLVRSPGGLALAQDNLKNFIHEVERHGFVPNGNRTYYLNRSQPPYLAPLVNLLRRGAGVPPATPERRSPDRCDEAQRASPFAGVCGEFFEPGDASRRRSGLETAAPFRGTSAALPVEQPRLLSALRTEHAFWTTRRAAPAGTSAAGLSRYGHHASPDYVMQFFREIKDRAGLPGGDETACREQAGHMLAECESGWDFTPRFDQRCEHFCPVDLNCNLYVLETTLAALSATGDANLPASSGKIDREPGASAAAPDAAARTEAATWRIRADARRHLVHALNWDADRGAFFDYDFAHARRSPVLSAATFQPLWSGLATEEQAASVVARALPPLERPHGLTACAPAIRQSAFRNPHSCQWDHPNLWPCLQAIAWRGLQRYGYATEARRIAQKYIDTVCRVFVDTGDLWEKYNADTGTHHASGDAGYETPAMMGWTAGVFLDAVALLEEEA